MAWQAGEARAQPVGDLTPLPARRLVVLLGEDGADRSGDHGALRRSDVSEQVAQDIGIHHLWQVACRTLAMAALRPSCVSEITSCTPRGPRRVRRKIDRGPNPDRSV